MCMAYHGAKYRADSFAPIISLTSPYYLSYLQTRKRRLTEFGNFLKDTGLGSHGAQIPAWKAGSTHDTLRCATSAPRQHL